MISFFIFHIHSDLAENNQQNNENDYNTNSCPGPNTIRIPIGDCKCKEGFPFGDPYDPKGCWKCADRCNSNAECVYPGKCICKESYFGDGINSCERKIPRIVDYAPSEGKNGTIVNITFSYPNASSSKSAFCKFGSIPVSATEITESYILCPAPHRKPSTVSLSISFDTLQWSNEDAVFIYLPEKDSFRFVQFFILSIVITLTGIFSIDKLNKFLHKKNDDEGIPLISTSKQNKKNAPINQMKKKKFGIF